MPVGMSVHGCMITPFLSTPQHGEGGFSYNPTALLLAKLHVANSVAMCNSQSGPDGM